jgi:hypothetical protein
MNNKVATDELDPEKIKKVKNEYFSEELQCLIIFFKTSLFIRYRIRYLPEPFPSAGKLCKVGEVASIATIIQILYY